MIKLLKTLILVLLALNVIALIVYSILPELFEFQKSKADMSWTEGWLVKEEQDGKRLTSVELHELQAQKSSINVIEEEETQPGKAQIKKTELPNSITTDSSRKLGFLWNPKALNRSDLFQESGSDAASGAEVHRGIDKNAPLREQTPKASTRKLKRSDTHPRQEVVLPEVEIAIVSEKSLPAVKLRTALAIASFQGKENIEPPEVALAYKAGSRKVSAANHKVLEAGASQEGVSPGESSVLKGAPTPEEPDLASVIIGEEEPEYRLQSATRQSEKTGQLHETPREKIPSGFLRLENKIYDPFSHAIRPGVWVRCQGSGVLEVMIEKKMVENLKGAPLSQDHLEIWIHKAGTSPPEGYGEISYQFGVGLGEDPWILQFISAGDFLAPQIRRHISNDFVVLEIAGFESNELLWNIVFSKAIMREEGNWEQGLLFSAAQNFEWGKKSSLFSLDKPLSTRQ
jgi:hypothetical protein